MLYTKFMLKKIHFPKRLFLNNYTELYEIDSRLKNIINPNYKSFLSEISIDYPENLNKIYKRTIPFLNNLKKKITR